MVEYRVAFSLFIIVLMVEYRVAFYFSYNFVMIVITMMHFSSMSGILVKRIVMNRIAIYSLCDDSNTGKDRAVFMSAVSPSRQQ